MLRVERVIMEFSRKINLEEMLESSCVYLHTYAYTRASDIQLPFYLQNPWLCLCILLHLEIRTTNK